jgi:hypothetical protein
MYNIFFDVDPIKEKIIQFFHFQPIINATECYPMSYDPCLFNLALDPCETNNIASSEPEILSQMLATLEAYNSTLVPSRKEPADVQSNPVFWNDTWISWYDITHPE